MGGSVTLVCQKQCETWMVKNWQGHSVCDLGREMIQQTGNCATRQQKLCLGKWLEVSVGGKNETEPWKCREEEGNWLKEEREATRKLAKLFRRGGAWKSSLGMFNDLMMLLLQSNFSKGTDLSVFLRLLYRLTWVIFAVVPVTLNQPWKSYNARIKTVFMAIPWIPQNILGFLFALMIICKYFQLSETLAVYSSSCTYFINIQSKTIHDRKGSKRKCLSIFFGLKTTDLPQHTDVLQKSKPLNAFDNRVRADVRLSAHWRLDLRLSGQFVWLYRNTQGK